MSRIAIVHKERCNPQGCGGYLCMRMCPINRMGKECIVVDPVDKKIKINEELTSDACSICQNCCPFDAIEIINLPEQLDQNPIHRYGKNGFCLYNLPTPVFGKVVGILGKNGIGKSTAIKVLVGLLKPNLGTEKEVSYDALLNFFRGTEAQIFFEKLKKGEIKAIYKPQQVELIPKTVKGTVREILKRSNETGKIDDVVEKLELKNVLETDISKISGGELQKVAIAVTALKKANLYVFDEPTSYLDIKQRLVVSNFIKSLADEKTAVLVVEHDLIILDSITDLIHIMYGKEACYGIVSQPKPTKNAINTFLSGYIKEQKMRFRNYEIKFSDRTIHKKVNTKEITYWENIVKKLGNFSLLASKGSVMMNDVIGVLGENGIGKTTFIKLLAKVIETDRGKLGEKIKVGYKPQYLNSDSEELVSVVLSEAIRKYENQLIHPLELDHFLNTKLCELSGGELQRVAIALCLSYDADLYLLDEPSAYLDVEQRLKIAKIIRDFAEKKDISIMIVDHDLIFINYLSDKLLIFDGTPAIKGECIGPFDMEKGMNLFLAKLGITLRRDKESNMPRINKKDSVMDKEQKKEGNYYYV